MSAPIASRGSARRVPRLTAFQAASAVLLLLASCTDGSPSTGTHIGNPNATAGFALTVTSDATDPQGRPAFQDDQGTSYSLTHARVYVRDIRLDLPSGTDCDDVAESLQGAICLLDDSGLYQIRIVGPFAIDLLTRQATPSLADVQLPAITYRRIDFRLDDGNPEDGVISAGDELDDRSLVARADFEYMETPVVLELLLNINEDARFEEAAGVTPQDGDALVALLDVGGWLGGIGIGACLDAGDLTVENGRLVIDEDAGDDDCDDLEDRIEENVKQSGRLEVEDD